MKKHCKECPWIVRNNNNDIILNFVKKTGKPHNCHMTKKGQENLWSVTDEKIMCLGSKTNILICNTKVSH